MGGPSKCSGVYDERCDNKGSFLACNMKALKTSSAGSCVYKKPPTWIKHSKVHCSGQSLKSFSTAAAAMNYCVQQGPSKCSGVYDERCDNKGSFLACNMKALKTSSAGSCVHKLAEKRVQVVYKSGKNSQSQAFRNKEIIKG